VLRSGPLDRAHIDKMVLGGAAAASIRVDRGLLFGDMSDFSKLNERQIAIFHDRVMGGFGKVLDRYGNVVEYTETAGDSIFGVLHDVSSVAECCVELQKAAEGGRIAAAGLPSFLMLRLSAHVGPVTPAFDHITKRNKFIGTEITRTARIEPKTPKGAVYVTEQFAATLYHDDDLRRFRCEYVGIRPMAKDYGECRMYSLQREDDSLQREEGA
jgi:class 3 adenylate cyclase